MILFQQYTDVAAWQLFGGWILAVVFVVKMILGWAWRTTANTDSYSLFVEKMKVPLPISGREYGDIVSPYIFERDKAISLWHDERKRHERDLEDLLQARLENTLLIDTVDSLEARISRLTDRSRGKNGRFEKNNGK